MPIGLRFGALTLRIFSVMIHFWFAVIPKLLVEHESEGESRLWPSNFASWPALSRVGLVQRSGGVYGTERFDGSWAKTQRSDAARKSVARPST